MKTITSIAIFFLAAGILTSVSILSIYQVLFAIPLIYYSYLAIKQKNIQLPRSAYWLIALAAVAALSLMTNLDIVPRPGKNFGKIKYFIYGIGGIFVFRHWIVEASNKTKKLLANTFLLSILIAAIYSCWELTYSPSGRAQGLTETMRYGYGSAMILTILLGCILHRKKFENWFDYRFGVVAFAFGFIGMYVTFTRGALL